MKVAHVITRMIVGGAQENTLASVAGLSALDRYDVTLLTGRETATEGDLLADMPKPGFELAYVPSLIRSVHPWHDPAALAWLHRWFSEARPDVVHTHSSKAGVVGRLAARSAQVPIVVHTLHSLVFHAYQPWPVRMTYRTVKRTMARYTDHYVSVSDDIRERAIAAGIGRSDQHSTIRSGFPTDAFVSGLMPRSDARARLGLPNDRVVIGVVGRLFPLKGHEEILKAVTPVVRQHPDLLFAFVGSGPLEPTLRRMARDQHLDRYVRFIGRLDPVAMPTAFSAFDLLAHASLREGLARVIPQAVLANLPVVCYDLDGSREVVSDGQNGFLVPPRDVDRLAERLALLAGDEELRKRFGGVGAERVQREFSTSEMVRRLDVLYRQLSGDATTRAVETTTTSSASSA